jgi:hypothetical protein
VRIVLALLLSLVACREEARSRVDPSWVIPERDERCDPTESRVCVGNDVVACDNGKLGRGLRTCHDGCKHGVCIGSCVDGAELIYVVDANNNFLSFDPRKLPADPFQLIGRLSCGRGGGSPFSMSVDRGGTAWVLYQDGELFEVSIANAKCERSGYVAYSSGSRTFGMGFVSDEPGGKTEKLFIAANDSSHALAYIDTKAATPTAQGVGVIEASRGMNPELTGTSEAKLFGFFPVDDGEPSFVQEIDRKSGAARGPAWTLGSDPLGHVSAYAFAQWGGVFYIFVTAGDSTVHAIDRATGKHKTAVEYVPYRITGAGVSTCAPERDGSAGTGTNMP